MFEAHTITTSHRDTYKQLQEYITGTFHCVCAVALRKDPVSKGLVTCMNVIHLVLQSKLPSINKLVSAFRLTYTTEFLDLFLYRKIYGS